MDRYETDAIVRAVDELLAGGAVYPPVYDAVTRRRVLERDSTGIRMTTGVLIMEGVITLAIQPLVERGASKVFAEVDAPTRLTRLREFYTVTKGLDERNAAAIHSAA